MEKLRFDPETIWQDSEFPNFRALDGILIPSNGNVFIADIRLPIGWESAIETLTESTGRKIEIFDASLLTTGLEMLLPPDDFFMSGEVAILVPGRGAKKVIDYLDQVRPELRKTLEKKNSLFYINTASQLQFWKDFSTYIIIDDVVVSGKTVNKIADRILDSTEVPDDIYYSRGWKPKRNPVISVYSWLSLDGNNRTKLAKENKSSPSSIELVDKLNTAVIYQGNNRIPACNSLSTLIEDTEKSRMVIEDLRSKYFPTELFDSFISSLRSANEK